MTHRITIELEASDATALLSTWESDLERLRNERSEIDQRIAASQNRVAALKAKLNGQELLPAHLTNPLRQPGDSVEGKRAPRGHNLKLIADYLAIEDKGKTPMEIARAINVGVSSVNAVLKGVSGSEKFEKTAKGGWKLKQ